MNRDNFQELALIRLKDAEHLLSGGRFDGAYYLSGYVIECALKACIAKRTSQYDFPPPRKVVEECYTHNLVALVSSAGLQSELKREQDNDPAFAVNWAIVHLWKEDSRYTTHDEIKARAIFEAVNDPDHGVLRWIKCFW